MTASGRFAVTAWSAVSPYGVGRDAFAEGLRTGRATAVAPDPEVWQVPDAEAHLVPVRAMAVLLGRKGTRAMDRATGLAVATVGDLLAHAPDSRVKVTGEGAALVLATAAGSVQSMMDFTRDGLVSEKPYFVDPARFPNAVMNRAAGACAIWHQMKGPNATIAGGRASGLHALRYTQRLLRAGRATAVVCGAVEEYSNARSWLEWHTRRDGDDDPYVLGEGCAVLQIEPTDNENALVEVLAVELGVAAGTGPTDVLADCLRLAVDRAGIGPNDVWAVARSGVGGRLGEQEAQAVAQVLGTGHIAVPTPIGDLSGAAAVFQVVAALVLAAAEPDAAGRVVAVTSVDRDGHTGCALLRLR